MKKFYQNLLHLLATGEDIVLATIFHSAGSAPRSAGAKMIVRADGAIIGTVGGGKLEAETMEMAKAVYQSRQSVIQPFNLTGTDAASNGMICGGQGEILLDYLAAADINNKLIYEALLATMATASKAWLITELAHKPAANNHRQQCLVTQQGKIIGNFQAEPAFLAKLARGPAKISIHTDAIEDRSFIIEPVKQAAIVYIFGAGHVAQQIAKLTDMVGFSTVVLDDRPAFANSERFPQAKTIVIDDFASCMSTLSISADSYLVIVTRGHLHDNVVLEQALATSATYIGMIGSRKKRDFLFQQLAVKGVPQAKLQQVHAPIGLDILAETPEEIAVSIVAEIIQTRAEQEKCSTPV